MINIDEYSIFIVARAPKEAASLHDPESAMDTMMDLLADYGGVTGANQDSWDAVVSVDAPDPHSAYLAAARLIGEAAAKAGYPDWPIVDVRVVMGDVLAEENTRPNIPALVSGPEVAELLGVNRQRVHQLAHAHPEFPKPLYRLGVGSLWDRHAIKRFASEWERRPGRPRKSA